jgi:hypothetical protein
MPFALLLIGAVLILTAIKGTYSELGTQLRTDFTGSGSHSFLIWLAAIGAVGALGYSPVLRTPSRMLLALVLLSMVITNASNGLFTRLTQTLGAAPANVALPQGQDLPLTGSIPVTLSGSGGSSTGSAGSAASDAAGAAKTALSFLPFLGL